MLLQMLSSGSLPKPSWRRRRSGLERRQPFSLLKRAFSWKEMEDKIPTVLAENGLFALLPKLQVGVIRS